MKCKIPEISWHNRDPVLSVDIQPQQSGSASSSQYRLASGGTDSHVLIWYMNAVADGTDIELDLAADLTRHQRAVNAVKWSPSGELLASGDDESVVFIWKQKSEHEPLNIVENTNEQDKEVWIVLKILRGHMEDIYDLSWSPNSQFLVSGSVDNTAIVWDVQKGKSQGLLRDHKSFVQGVAWDPKNQYIATLSSDRHLRIFDIQTKKVLYRINKTSLPVGEAHELHGQRVQLFHDDTLQTFFRRLCFTPDGKLLLTPAGVIDNENAAKSLHTTYAFSRHALRQPAIVLPCPGQYTVAVRCCPLLFRLRPHKAEVNPPVVPLPYRMIFAVATRCSVYFYDTQQREPFAVISNIHYTRLTDVTWSSDGHIVVVSSTDGFCSLITFEPGELGEVYEDANLVLGANEMSTVVKKVKKQKENDGQTTRNRKGSMDEIAIAAKREPLLEKTAKQQATVAMEVDEQATDSCKVVVESETKNTETESVEEPEKSAPLPQTVCAQVGSGIAITKTLAASIIIDKEILSSDEKFESPEKKSRPATPIMIRRTPRSATLTTTIPMALGLTPKADTGTSASTTNNCQSPAVNSNAIRSSMKTATPIAVRRAPRAIITLQPQPVTGVTATDEALDAWPQPMETEEEKITSQMSNTPSKSNINVEVAKVATPHEITLDCSEDIRLIYEESTEGCSNLAPRSLQPVQLDAKATNEVTKTDEYATKSVTDFGTPKQKGSATPTQIKQPRSNSKTPRRVALTTLSTPKSKKKLLD